MSQWKTCTDVEGRERKEVLNVGLAGISRESSSLLPNHKVSEETQRKVITTVFSMLKVWQNKQNLPGPTTSVYVCMNA